VMSRDIEDRRTYVCGSGCCLYWILAVRAALSLQGWDPCARGVIHPRDLNQSGNTMETPCLSGLVRRLRSGDPTASAEVTDDGSARIVWRQEGLPHSLTLLTTEQDLCAAVTAIGQDCRDALWPGNSVEEAGLNLLLVHLDEVIATRDTSQPLLIDSTGLVWPEARPARTLDIGGTDLEWSDTPVPEQGET